MDLNTVAANVLELLGAEAESEGLSLTDDLTDPEQKVRDVVLRIGAKATEMHLSGKPLGYEGSSRACDHPHCRHDQRFVRFVGHSPRTLATLLGQVTIRQAEAFAADAPDAGVDDLSGAPGGPSAL